MHMQIKLDMDSSISVTQVIVKYFSTWRKEKNPAYFVMFVQILRLNKLRSCWFYLSKCYKDHLKIQ